VATDVQRLRSGELCRLLNSTPLGECLGERPFHRHRTRAGLRIAADGDPQRINLLRYLAWLFDQRHAPPSDSAPATGGDSVTSGAAAGAGYEAHRDRMRLRASLESISGRNIGELPAVQDATRRNDCERNFRGFCERYLPQTFHLKWSPDHLKVIAKIETAVLEGGLFAMAMPRGSGKTSLCETACLWALLYGHRAFVALIGSDEEHAANMLDSIKAELENSDLLLGDFPEVCFPIRKLAVQDRALRWMSASKHTWAAWPTRVARAHIQAAPSARAPPQAHLHREVWRAIALSGVSMHLASQAPRAAGQVSAWMVAG